MKLIIGIIPALCAFGVMVSWCPSLYGDTINILSTQEAEYGYNGSAFVVGGPDQVGLVGGTSGAFSSDSDYRYAFQFSLSSLPAGASITGASLQLQDSAPQNTPNTLNGFAGDGTFSSASVQGGAELQTFRRNSSSAFTEDVTAFVQSLTAGQEAGFYLQQSTLGYFPDGYDAPQLTLTYTTAVPEPGALFLVGIPLCLGLWLRKRKTAHSGHGSVGC